MLVIDKGNWRYKWYAWTYEAREKTPPKTTSLCAMFWTTMFWSLILGLFTIILCAGALITAPIWVPCWGIGWLCERLMAPATRQRVGAALELWIMGRILPGLLGLAFLALVGTILYNFGWMGLLGIILWVLAVLLLIGACGAIAWLWEHKVQGWLHHRQLTKEARAKLREDDPGYQLLQGWKRKFCPIVTFREGA